MFILELTTTGELKMLKKRLENYFKTSKNLQTLLLKIQLQKD